MFIGKYLPLFLCLAPFAVQATPTYSVTVVAPARSIPTAINDLGYVVGTVAGAVTSDGNPTNYGFVSSDGFYKVGPLGANTVVQAINDSGVAAGSGFAAGNHKVAFIDSPGGSAQTFNPFGGSNSLAAGINNAGQVVGTGYDWQAGNAHPFLMSNGAVTDLGSLGGTWGYGNAINNKGEAAGVSELTGDTTQHAFLYANGAMTDLGTLNGTSGWSWATGINDNSQVIGYASFILPGAAHQHAFLYSNGVMNDLGTLGGFDSQAAGINNLGQVVGHSQGSFYGNHGFLFSDGAMLDLNALIDPALGWNIVDAVDINNNGQIAAYALSTKDGLGYALRLDLASPVPEPASAAMLLGGAGLLLLRSRRKRAA